MKRWITGVLLLLTVLLSVTVALTVVTVFFSFQGCALMEMGILPLL